jgi:branched-subunit amino acid ABC-type transport system permease component
LPSILFGAVIVVLLVRPGGLFTRRGQRAIERV